MSLFFRLKKFIEYQWAAKTQYYLHSPFAYRFYLDVLLDKPTVELSSVVSYRKKLRSNYSAISITDFGTGISRSVAISHLERKVAVPHKYGKLLYSVVKQFKPETILEIGTSIGLSSSYMGLGSPGSKIISLEGSHNIAQVAKQTHAVLNITNIEVVEGEFSESIPSVLSKAKKFDLIYFDGNHTKEATLKYFELCLSAVHQNSVLIFDDIYWSPGMCEAWEQIKEHPSVTVTIDLYKVGICFFKKEKLAKENFVLRY
jgi:predicted O-methyltransferase YrrM